jgi:hypothetical protein
VLWLGSPTIRLCHAGVPNSPGFGCVIERRWYCISNTIMHSIRGELCAVLRALHWSSAMHYAACWA